MKKHLHRVLGIHVSTEQRNNCKHPRIGSQLDVTIFQCTCIPITLGMVVFAICTTESLVRTLRAPAATIRNDGAPMVPRPAAIVLTVVPTPLVTSAFMACKCGILWHCRPFLMHCSGTGPRFLSWPLVTWPPWTFKLAAWPPRLLRLLVSAASLVDASHS